MSDARNALRDLGAICAHADNMQAVLRKYMSSLLRLQNSSPPQNWGISPTIMTYVTVIIPCIISIPEGILNTKGIIMYVGKYLLPHQSSDL